jgi:hypothetical protein
MVMPFKIEIAHPCECTKGVDEDAFAMAEGGDASNDNRRGRDGWIIFMLLRAPIS